MRIHQTGSPSAGQLLELQIQGAQAQRLHNPSLGKQGATQQPAANQTFTIQLQNQNQNQNQSQRYLSSLQPHPLMSQQKQQQQQANQAQLNFHLQHQHQYQQRQRHDISHLHLQPAIQNLVHKRQLKQQQQSGARLKQIASFATQQQQMAESAAKTQELANDSYKDLTLTFQQQCLGEQLSGQVAAAAGQVDFREMQHFPMATDQFSNLSPQRLYQQQQLEPELARLPAFRPRVSSVSAASHYQRPLQSPAAATSSASTSPFSARSTSFSAPASHLSSAESVGTPPPMSANRAQCQGHHLMRPASCEQQLSPQPMAAYAALASGSLSPATSSSGSLSGLTSSQLHAPMASLSPKTAGQSGGGAGESQTLGINLEQYISKRNERERSRVRNVNDAFENLKNSLPLDVDKLTKRMSKVEILRSAISYIRDLEDILGCKQQQQQERQSEMSAAPVSPSSSSSSSLLEVNQAQKGELGTCRLYGQAGVGPVSTGEPGAPQNARGEPSTNRACNPALLAPRTTDISLKLAPAGGLKPPSALQQELADYAQVQKIVFVPQSSRLSEKRATDSLDDRIEAERGLQTDLNMGLAERNFSLDPIEGL